MLPVSPIISGLKNPSPHFGEISRLNDEEELPQAHQYALRNGGRVINYDKDYAQGAKGLYVVTPMGDNGEGKTMLEIGLLLGHLRALTGSASRKTEALHTCIEETIYRMLKDAPQWHYSAPAHRSAAKGHSDKPRAVAAFRAIGGHSTDPNGHRAALTEHSANNSGYAGWSWEI